MRNILLTEEQFMQCVQFILNEGITLSNARGFRKANTGQSKNKRTVVTAGGEGFKPTKKGFSMTPEAAKVIENAREIFYPDIDSKIKNQKNVEKRLANKYGDKYDDLLDEYIRKFEELGIPLDRNEVNRPLKRLRKAIYDCCTAEVNKLGDINRNVFRDKANGTGDLGVEAFMNITDVVTPEIIDKYKQYKLDERDAKIKSAFLGVSTGTGNSDDTTMNDAGRKAHATETKNPNQIRKWLNKRNDVTFKQLINVFKGMSNAEKFTPPLFEKGTDYKAYTFFETNSNSELNNILINYFSNSIQSGQQRTAMPVTDKTNKKTGKETKQYNYKIVFATFNHPIEVDKISLHGDYSGWQQRQVDALIRDYKFEADDAWDAIDNHVTPKGFFVVTTTTPTPTQKMDTKNRRMAQMK